ncbi:MAG: glycoside hydrolase family 125 protein [Pleomorphochaeta sp.]
MSNIVSYSTGNEFISLDNINVVNASISNFTIIHMQSKGLLDFRGEQDSLFNVEIKRNNEKINFENIKWDLINYWIPKATVETEFEKIEIIILTALKQKGFAYHLDIINKTSIDFEYEINFYGTLNSVYHCVNEEKYFNGCYEAYSSNWNNKGPVLSISNGFPVISLAPVVDKAINWDYTKVLPLTYSSSSKLLIDKKSNDSITCYWGVGYEEVSSITAAIEMNRLGFKFLLDEMIEYLNKIVKRTNDEDFNNLLNRNLIYTLFYSTGLTIDTEERVIVTSRSPKYYVSAAYWDRDSLLWAFPAIVHADKNVAREIVEYISTIQSKNIGIHSRFIDGTVLEPGFELDELCSFVIALDYYIRKTGDKEILSDYNVVRLIDKILKILVTKKSEKLGLYETFLQPTDDMRVYPYLTYNNVLVWKTFKILESWDFKQKSDLFFNEAESIYDSIYDNCIRTINGKKQFIWSVDSNGNFDIYDEPPGSLVLLPVFDFITKDDEIYKNTIKVIFDENYEFSFSKSPFGAIGCPHAPHPWVLSLANNVRVFNDKDSLEKLKRAKMDNGIACESIDENTGYCTTGEAFATCAGYLSFSLLEQIDSI